MYFWLLIVQFQLFSGNSLRVVLTVPVNNNLLQVLVNISHSLIWKFY